MAVHRNLESQRFGKLTVIKEDGRKSGSKTYRCQCDCGNIKSYINGASLRRNATQSCGCGCGCNTQKGSKHHQSKLKEEEVLLIRKYYNEGYSMGSLASIYKITKTTIFLICHRKSWKHV